jgi:L-ascorbate 6-phosphate lactonase
MQSNSRQDALKRQIEMTNLPNDLLSLWYLGQEGFVFKYSGVTVCIDPYLSNWVYELSGEPWSRAFDPPLDPASCPEFDYVICTHHHEDHMDKLTLQALKRSSPNTKFIVPRAHLGLLREWGIEEARTIGISHGETLDLAGIQIQAFAAMHERLEQDSSGEHLYLGYLFRFGGISVYHAGDTLIYRELVKWVTERKPDIALIPINGRDYVRSEAGIVGNCNYRDAADLSVNSGADVVIPIHYGLFPHNDENPAYFVDYLYRRYPKQKFHMFIPGEHFVYYKNTLLD